MDRYIAFTMALAGSLAVMPVYGGDVRPVQRPNPAAAGLTGNAQHYFDIAPQSLQTALDVFSAATGWSGFYSADTMSGRVSRALSGWHAPDAALRLLTDGSGLQVYYTAADAFVLEPSAPAPASVPDQNAQPVEALLQASVRDVFCREPRLAAGDYRVAFSLRLGSLGRVVDARLLGSTGNTARDSDVLTALGKIDVGASLDRPAFDTAQSFVMLILPRPANSRECATATP